MNNIDQYFEELNQIQSLFNRNEIYQALSLAKHLLSQAPDNPDLQLHCTAIFIDCGSTLKDIEAIELGISLINDLLQKDEFPSHVNQVLRYNLSNGYASLASLHQASGSDEAMLEAFQNQKQLLQSVLLEKESLPDELLPNAITNYANILDQLGRTVEAVDHYYDCLRIVPNHAVAMGNCGSALQRLLNISVAHNPKILYEAWWLMKKANQLKPDLIRLSGEHAFLHCQNALANFEKYLESVVPDGYKGIEKQITEFETVHTWEPSPMLTQLESDRLLLTVNPRLSNCPTEYTDDICFENIVLATDDSGQKLFCTLSHSFNHAKEDFATARYLYYQSQSQEAALIEASTITSYIDTLDYADFGLRSGFLKSSLRLAADLLDKCAGFINLYLNLGHPEDFVTLKNLWYVDRSRKKGLHPEVKLRLRSNQYLHALWDLKTDLFLGKYPAPFNDLRNDTTHKRLVLSWYGSLDETDSSHSLREFQKNIRFLLRMAKAAIIYTTGIVMIEEQQRKLKYQNLEGKKRTTPGLSFRVGLGLSDEVDRFE